MSRTLSGTLSSILALPKRDIQWTIDLTFPDATSFKFATAPLTISGRGTYTNDLEDVGDIRQSLEAPADNVSIGIQNKDRVLGLHVATYWQKWRKAEAVIGRYYRDQVPSPSLTEWIEMFRGSVQQPNANDFKVTFDVLADTLTPGEIVTRDSLAPQCQFVFKDPKTCKYVGAETVCDHNLKSQGGCTGRDNEEHFGGMEHYQAPDADVPGTGGNTEDPGGGDDGGGPCPRTDQYTLVRGNFGKPAPKMVCFVTEDDWIWNPFLQDFRKIRSARIERDQEIWELLTATGALGFSSFLHRVIEHLDDRRGRAAELLAERQATAVSVLDAFALQTSQVIFSRDTGERGDVMRIEVDAELEEEKIYCYGDNPAKLIACHNRKNDLPY